MQQQIREIALLQRLATVPAQRIIGTAPASSALIVPSTAAGSSSTVAVQRLEAERVVQAQHQHALQEVQAKKAAIADLQRQLLNDQYKLQAQQEAYEAQKQKALKQEKSRVAILEGQQQNGELAKEDERIVEGTQESQPEQKQSQPHVDVPSSLGQSRARLPAGFRLHFFISQ